MESVLLVHSDCAEMVRNVWRYGKRGKTGWEIKFIGCLDPFFFLPYAESQSDVDFQVAW